MSFGDEPDGRGVQRGTNPNGEGDDLSVVGDGHAALTDCIRGERNEAGEGGCSRGRWKEEEDGGDSVLWVSPVRTRPRTVHSRLGEMRVAEDCLDFTRGSSNERERKEKQEHMSAYVTKVRES